MINIFARKIGSMICKWILEEKKVKKDLEGLNEILKMLFSELDKLEIKDVKFQYSSTMLNGKLVTKSKCPIYKYYPPWCEKGCIEFISTFTRTFNRRINVERIKKQPESDFCEFEFIIK